jgi:hypothetical protein
MRSTMAGMPAADVVDRVDERFREVPRHARTLSATVRARQS